MTMQRRSRMDWRNMGFWRMPMAPVYSGRSSLLWSPSERALIM